MRDMRRGPPLTDCDGIANDARLDPDEIAVLDFHGSTVTFSAQYRPGTRPL